MRHGDSLGGIPDSDRGLSDTGVKQVILASKAHIDVFHGIEIVYSSPYRRAHQTASLILGNLRFKNNFEINFNNDLMPAGNVLLLTALLEKSLEQRILFVSHMPILGNLVDYLTGETGTFLNTASVASLSMDYPGERLALINWIHDVT